jgi:MFS family permease
MVLLFGGVALVNTAVVGASATGTLVAAEAYGDGWGGAPNAAAVAGTAAGAFGLSLLMARRGPRFGLVAGYGVGASGALLAAAAVVTGLAPLLVAGMVLLGVGNGGAQLSRYVAADLYPAEEKGRALSVVVWGGTVGAVVGPGLLAPSATAAQALRLPPLAGPFLVALSAAAVAGLAAVCLPRPRTVALPAAAPRQPSERLAELVRLPAVGTALTAMVVAQLVMVAVMTMTPLHLDHHGHGLEVIGGVLSAHTFGMFALSPVSGWLTDRRGGRAAICWGLVALAVAVLLAGLAPAGRVAVLTGSLFLLGYGWNLCYVGGSSLLARELPAGAHARDRGTVDALVWGTSALASLGAGGLLAAGGFSLVVAVAGATLLLPLLAVVTRPSAPPPRGPV